jgi:hypothetical protein
VEPHPPIENEQGVDVSQIERQLRMSIPERVREMVHTANVFIAIQDRARVVPDADD